MIANCHNLIPIDKKKKKEKKKERKIVACHGYNTSEEFLLKVYKCQYTILLYSEGSNFGGSPKLEDLGYFYDGYFELVHYESQNIPLSIVKSLLLKKWIDE